MAIGYIYKTTNLITNKFYIGKRQKPFFDVYYYGSGKHFTASLIKYGKENFNREILQWCDTEEELNNAEKYWIKELNAQNLNIGYNISEGGEGCAENGKLNALYCYVHNNLQVIRILKTDLNSYISAGYEKGKGYGSNGLLGHHHSESTKEKMTRSGKGKHNHEGENNPCFGSHYMWINDTQHNMRLPLGESVPEGWVRGKLQKKATITDKELNRRERLRIDNHWKGDKNPSKTMTGESKKKKKEKYSMTVKGRKWWNNGDTEVLNKYCPEGFVAGRLKNAR